MNGLKNGGFLAHHSRIENADEAAIRLTFLGGGLMIGFVTAPGEWYVLLAKPPLTRRVGYLRQFGLLSYILIASVGWRTRQRNRAGRPMQLWWAQLLLNFLWSPVFFSAHRIDLALALILLLLLIILGFIVTSWRKDRMVAWLFAPYAVWVANASIFSLN